ncbi:MAG: hypothetical protein ACOX0Z_01505 [Candidatus Nanosyncoccaceae bacterium]|jgi:hypothetical protein
MAGNESNYSQEFIRQLNNAPEKKPISIKLLLIGGALLALALIIFVIISANAPKPINIRQVLARTRSMEKITKHYHNMIDDTTLRSLNSSLSVTLTNFNRDGEAYYQANTPKNQIKKEAKSRDANLSEVTQAFDLAELNNRLDRTYVIQVSYQIDLIITEQEKLLDRTKGEKLRTLLTQGINDLEQIKTQLKELTLN